MSKPIEYGRPWWEVMKEVSEENDRLKAENERLRKVANNYLDVCDKYALFRCDEERLMARVLALELRNAAKEGKPSV